MEPRFGSGAAFQQSIAQPSSSAHVRISEAGVMSCTQRNPDSHTSATYTTLKQIPHNVTYINKNHQRFMNYHRSKNQFSTNISSTVPKNPGNLSRPKVLWDLTPSLFKMNTEENPSSHIQDSTTCLSTLKNGTKLDLITLRNMIELIRNAGKFPETQSSTIPNTSNHYTTSPMPTMQSLDLTIITNDDSSTHPETRNSTKDITPLALLDNRNCIIVDNTAVRHSTTVPFIDHVRKIHNSHRTSSFPIHNTEKKKPRRGCRGGQKGEKMYTLKVTKLRKIKIFNLSKYKLNPNEISPPLPP